MSKTFRYAICNNKITQIHGLKAVWYDDEGNRRVEEVKYIVADNWEQAKEFIKQGRAEVAISKTETPTKTITPTETIRASECMMVAVAENATTTQTRPEPLNMAYAREALITIRRLASDAVGGNLDAWANYLRSRQIQTLAEIALATPARQCDAAKLRKALTEIMEYIDSFHKYITPGKGKKLTALFAVADTVRNKARAALATASIQNAQED